MGCNDSNSDFQAFLILFDFWQAWVQVPQTIKSFREVGLWYAKALDSELPDLPSTTLSKFLRPEGKRWQPSPSYRLQVPQSCPRLRVESLGNPTNLYQRRPLSQRNAWEIVPPPPGRFFVDWNTYQPPSQLDTYKFFMNTFWIVCHRYLALSFLHLHQPPLVPKLNQWPFLSSELGNQNLAP